MNKSITQPNTAENKQILLKIKENLREEVLEGVKNFGLRQRLFSEYYELAKCTSTLLSMLQNKGFSSQLSDKERQEYDKLMTTLSCCGLRTQILLEQSTSEEYEQVLQSSQPVSGLAN